MTWILSGIIHSGSTTLPDSFHYVDPNFALFLETGQMLLTKETSVPEPDPPDPHVFGPSGSEPLVRGMDPDPEPEPDLSVIKQK